MLALGDALAFVLGDRRQFSAEDFARFHPAGSLGRQLTRVEVVMRRGPDLRLASADETVRQVFAAHSRGTGRRTGAVMLTHSDGTLCGLFTDSDLARLFERRHDAALDRPVREVMTANPLSIDPNGHAGSQPYGETKLWKAVNQREYTYIRGHLLNHHVHGPGSNENLVPITRSANTLMETQGEDKIKNAVVGDNKVVYYKVEAKGKHSGRKHLPEENELPEKMILNAWELEEADDGSWTKKGADILKNYPISNSLGQDVPVGLIRVEVNLSSASRKEIDSIPNIGPVIADRIVKLRRKAGGRFSVYDELLGADGIGADTVEELRKDKWVKLH